MSPVAPGAFAAMVPFFCAMGGVEPDRQIALPDEREVLMAVPVLNLIGPGRVGLALALLWKEAGIVELAGVAGRTLESARIAVDLLGVGRPCQLEALPPADLTLIAVPDGVIADLADKWARTGLAAGGIAFHASGALGSAALQPLREAGLRVASAHPARSFPDARQAAAGFAGTPVALEGDEAALAVLERLFVAVGGQPFRLTADAKPAYHAACAIASNYAVVLADLALRVAIDAGLAPRVAQAVLAPLATQSLANAFALGPVAALTGPVARGDAATVAAHLAVLHRPLDEAAYRALGRLALELVRVDEPKRSALAGILGATG